LLPLEQSFWVRPLQQWHIPAIAIEIMIMTIVPITIGTAIVVITTIEAMVITIDTIATGGVMGITTMAITIIIIDAIITTIDGLSSLRALGPGVERPWPIFAICWAWFLTVGRSWLA
jgi:hypothetical protein